MVMMLEDCGRWILRKDAVRVRVRDMNRRIMDDGLTVGTDNGGCVYIEI